MSDRNDGDESVDDPQSECEVFDLCSGSFFDGWWRTDETGGIKPDGVLIGGDGPADVMGDAIDEIIGLYHRRWGRDPTAEELSAVLQFVLGGLGWERAGGPAI